MRSTSSSVSTSCTSAWRLPLPSTSTWSTGSIATGTTGFAQRGRSADKLLLLLDLFVERERDRLADLVAVLVLALVSEHVEKFVALVDQLADKLRRCAAVVVVARPGRRDLDHRHRNDVAVEIGVDEQLLLDLLA